MRARVSLESLWLPERRRAGLLVVLEGFDGAGKSVQAEALRRELGRRGRTVRVVAHPTARYLEDPYVRSYLDGGGDPRTARVLALLSAADLLRSTQEDVLPALEREEVVIMHRYVYAAIALGADRGVDLDLLLRINANVPRPDVAVLLDAPANVLLARLALRDGSLRFEERSEAAIAAVLHRFAALGDALVPVDATRPPDEVAARILALVEAAASDELEAAP